jgi:hypothetical protein
MGSVGPGGSAHHTIATLGLGAANRNDLESVWAGLERANDLRRDAHDIPLAKLEHLAVQQHATGSGDDDVGLFLLAVTVGHRTAQAGLIADVADSEITRVKVLAAKPALNPRSPVADDVFDLQQVHDSEAGHIVSSGW